MADVWTEQLFQSKYKTTVVKKRISSSEENETVKLCLKRSLIKSIEKLQDNDFLEDIKSIRYHETENYRRLLNFIESEPYQVLGMGHSCGNSDRTLLNTLFEHRNCISIKVYYHQREDGTDNYSDLIRNLSRNFNDKAAMRDTIVNKKMCSPLVPVIRNRWS